MQKVTSLSFCGCGFLATYHFGVAYHLLCNRGLLLNDVQRFAGVSGGGLVAAMLVCRPEFFEFESKRYGLAEPSTLEKNVLVYFLPRNAYEKASGVLYVSLTNHATRKNEVFSEFTSNEDLIQCLMCSCFIPGLCGYELPTFRGQHYIDGAFSNNLYVFDEGLTVTVSPFRGPQLIATGNDKPRRLCVNIRQQDFHLSWRNLILMYRDMSYRTGSTEKFGEYHWLRGNHDTSRFLGSKISGTSTLKNPAYGSKRS